MAAWLESVGDKLEVGFGKLMLDLDSSVPGESEEFNLRVGDQSLSNRMEAHPDLLLASMRGGGACGQIFVRLSPLCVCVCVCHQILRPNEDQVFLPVGRRSLLPRFFQP